MPNALRIPCEGSQFDICGHKFEVKKERGRRLWIESVGNMSGGFSSNQFDNFKINEVKFGNESGLRIINGKAKMIICAGLIKHTPKEENKVEEKKPEEPVKEAI